jgi:tetratricopeptide (TPR) repeat protein
MAYDTQDLDIGTIRRLLTESFTAEDLRRFCLDRPTFRPVVGEFGPGLGLNDMVDRLIEYCGTRLLWDELLADVKECRPHQYERFEPGLRMPKATSAPYTPSPPPEPGEPDSNYAHTHNDLGIVYCDLKDYKKAIAAFQRAIELDPEFANPHNGLGIVY